MKPTSAFAGTSNVRCPCAQASSLRQATRTIYGNPTANSACCSVRSAMTPPRLLRFCAYRLRRARPERRDVRHAYDGEYGRSCGLRRANVRVGPRNAVSPRVARTRAACAALLLSRLVDRGGGRERGWHSLLRSQSALYRYHATNVTDVLGERTTRRQRGYRWKELREFRERLEYLAMLPGHSKAFLERLRDLWIAREQQWISLALACFMYRNGARLFALRKAKHHSFRHILRYATGLRLKRIANPFGYAPAP